MWEAHRRSQGVQWVLVHPPRVVKNFLFRPNLQEKCVSAPPGHEVHPQPEQESIFRIVFAGFGSIYAQTLRATTKKQKKVVNFFWQKSAPQTKSCYAYMGRPLPPLWKCCRPRVFLSIPEPHRKTFVPDAYFAHPWNKILRAPAHAAG